MALACGEEIMSGGQLSEEKDEDLDDAFKENGEFKEIVRVRNNVCDLVITHTRVFFCIRRGAR